MSVCEGGGWNPHDKQGPLTKRCPGMYVRNKPFICYFGKEPDTCPHVAALKAVVENPELVLVAVPKGTKYLSINNACLSIDEVLPDES